MPVDVCWLNYNPKAIARGYWDNELPERILRGQRHLEGEWSEDDGCVVIIPGQHNHQYVDELSADLKRYRWVVLMVTGDEEGLFPWDQLDHHNMKTWAFAPNSEGAFSADRLLPFGPSPHGFTDLPKTLDWFFAGQINTPERKAMAQALRGLPNGKLVETHGFAQGMSPAEYVTVMNRTRVAPCPPAWKHPDSFRVWEALDAGAIPVGDFRGPYWERVDAPIDMHTDWTDPAWIVHPAMNDWTAYQTKAWWLRRQYEYRRWLRQDIMDLGGPDIAPPITVVIPTSPIPSHPSVRIINETINSITARLDAPILVMCDGIRPEQEDRRADYQKYLRELVRLPGITPVIFDEHQHQGVMTRKTLESVDSPWLLFVEHDTPLTGDIPWELLMEQDADVIRLYPETRLEPQHGALMGMRRGDFTRTEQWSQRPHLARTDYYRKIMDRYFGWQSRTMIEDVMHGVAQNLSWDQNRIVIYTPDGNIQRSLHLDARGDDPKFEMVYDYDGDPPEGAPYPTRLRR